MQHAPVIIHILVARFAVSIAGKRNVRPIREKLKQLVPQRFVFQREKCPRPQPGPLERDQINVEIAALSERPAPRSPAPPAQRASRFCPPHPDTPRAAAPDAPRDSTASTDTRASRWPT